jgi:hypothetical protein
MKIRLSISTAWKNKLDSNEFHRAATMELATMTIQELRDHVRMGYAFCCAELKSEDPTKCRRVLANFMGAQTFGVDVDGGSDWKALKNNQYLQDYAAFMYTTASHTDAAPRMRIIFAIDRPIVDASEYKRLTVAMAEKFGGDKNATDAVRIWYGSEDCKVHTFGNVMPVNESARIIQDAEEAERESMRYSTFTTRRFVYDDLQQMLSATPAQQDHIEWKRFIAGVFNHFGPDPKIFDMLQRWSPSKVPYAKLYESRMQRITIGTSIYIARTAGTYKVPDGFVREDPKTAAESYDHVEQYLRTVAKFRRNEITSATEFCRYVEDIHTVTEVGKGGVVTERTVETWNQIDDYFLNSCLRQMGRLKIKTSKERLIQVLNSDFAADDGAKFNAVKDYFDSIQHLYDETTKEDYILLLAMMIPPRKNFVEDAPTQLRNNVTILKRWLVASYMCATANIPNQIMLILQGGQGTGKTRLLRHLCPVPLRENHFYEGDIVKDKDILRRVYTSFIAVDDELAGMSRSELSFMKSEITKNRADLRKVYNAEDTHYRRMVNYAGTVNEDTFLEDPTGNRRFPVIPVGGYIARYKADGSFKEIETFNINNLWAQAQYLASQGESPRFTDQEKADLTARIKEFERSNMFDELVAKHVVSTEQEAGAVPMSATDILFEINARLQDEEKFSSDPRHHYQLAKSLVRAGYQTSRKMVAGKSHKGYLVRVLNVDESKQAQIRRLKGGAEWLN